MKDTWIHVSTSTYPYELVDNQNVILYVPGNKIISSTSAVDFYVDRNQINISSAYAKDKVDVYCDGEVVPDADPLSFNLIYGMYSKIGGEYFIRFAKDNTGYYLNCGRYF